MHQCQGRCRLSSCCLRRTGGGPSPPGGPAFSAGQSAVFLRSRCFKAPPGRVALTWLSQQDPGVQSGVAGLALTHAAWRFNNIHFFLESINYAFMPIRQLLLSPLYQLSVDAITATCPPPPSDSGPTWALGVCSPQGIRGSHGWLGLSRCHGAFHPPPPPARACPRCGHGVQMASGHVQPL